MRTNLQGALLCSRSHWHCCPVQKPVSLYQLSECPWDAMCSFCLHYLPWGKPSTYINYMGIQHQEWTRRWCELQLLHIEFAFAPSLFRMAFFCWCHKIFESVIVIHLLKSCSQVIWLQNESCYFSCQDLPICFVFSTEDYGLPVNFEKQNCSNLTNKSLSS